VQQPTVDLERQLAAAVLAVPDFPRKGVLFRDITPVLQDPVLCARVIDAMAQGVREQRVQAVAGVESRGFLFGLPLALRLGVPFFPIRKKGKLPRAAIGVAYALEYGTAEMEMHADAIAAGTRVLVHDDLLATGGTALAAAQLIHQQGGQVVAFSYLIELLSLNGKQRLASIGAPIHHLIAY
jgi:adenine phosphoribosyltransferase